MTTAEIIFVLFCFGLLAAMFSGLYFEERAIRRQEASLEYERRFFAPHMVRFAERHFQLLDADADGLITLADLDLALKSSNLDTAIDAKIISHMRSNLGMIGHVISSRLIAACETVHVLASDPSTVVAYVVPEEREYTYGISRQDLSSYVQRLQKTV